MLQTTKTALNKLKDTDMEAYAKGLEEFYQKHDIGKHERVKLYKHDIKRLTEQFLNCKTTAERDSIVKEMFSTREMLLEDVKGMTQQ